MSFSSIKTATLCIRMLILLAYLYTPFAYAEHITLKILGINDFHGQISAGRFIGKEPVGGAAVLASYLKQAQVGMDGRTLITVMGDLVGASPPISGLLHDEPTILFLNSLGNSHCSANERLNPLCNLVATIGNHEFDKGQQAMHDLIYGKAQAPTDDWIPLPTYSGAAYPYISANIVDSKTGKTIFPPYTIKVVDSIRIAFVGAVLKNAAESMFPANAEGVSFLDEATAINSYIPEIKAQGVDVIVVLIHEGGNQTPYEGPTQRNRVVEGAINDIIFNLDDTIDVVMGGHTHQFLNAYLPNRHHKEILVTQANSYSTSFAEVSLVVDAQNHQVINKSAQIITTYANRWPGTEPDQNTQNLIKLAESKVEPIINSPVGILGHDLSPQDNSDGESNLGNLVADAFRAELDTDIGITNLHGLRNDLKKGALTWGDIYSVMPFSNTNVVITLTGQDIYDLLEQQWTGSYTNMLQVSGIRYSYNLERPLGKRIISVLHQERPLQKNKTYTIATTDFMASGGGVFSVMKRSQFIRFGHYDHETVIQYIKKLPQPFYSFIDGRISNMK